MPDLELPAVLVATVAAFACGGAYYAALGDRLALVSDVPAESPEPWRLGAELLRCLVLAAVVAGLAAQGRIDEWTGGLALGLTLWVGFPAVLLGGAMLHERMRFGHAAIHAGDWLLKLLLVGALVAVLQ
ncbi:MAG TPA: DUF1761 domain-containing protein [Solirubrobacteraceae bacterium]|nr:DUF1761 domain-containing protein [Solirubrobacteraceae bacterium]